jgi:hypothetical protein
MKLKIIYLPIIMGVITSGCGAGGPTMAPVVDMTGVNQQTYNKDLAFCYQHMPLFAVGNPVTKCMQAKGYKIVVGY